MVSISQFPQRHRAHTVVAVILMLRGEETFGRLQGIQFSLHTGILLNYKRLMISTSKWAVASLQPMPMKAITFLFHKSSTMNRPMCFAHTYSRFQLFSGYYTWRTTQASRDWRSSRSIPQEAQAWIGSPTGHDQDWWTPDSWSSRTRRQPEVSCDETWDR